MSCVFGVLADSMGLGWVWIKHLGTYINNFINYIRWQISFIILDPCLPVKTTSVRVFRVNHCSSAFHSSNPQGSRYEAKLKYWGMFEIQFGSMTSSKENVLNISTNESPCYTTASDHSSFFIVVNNLNDCS